MHVHGFCEDLNMIAIIGTSDRSCCLAEALQIFFLTVNVKPGHHLWQLLHDKLEALRRDGRESFMLSDALLVQAVLPCNGAVKDTPLVGGQHAPQLSL